MDAPGNPFYDETADETVAAMSSESAQLYSLELSNIDAADYFIQLFDLATSDVTLGSTTPTMSFLIPAGDASKRGAMDKFWPGGVIFNTALTYAITTTAGGASGPSTDLVLNAVLG